MSKKRKKTGIHGGKRGPAQGGDSGVRAKKHLGQHFLRDRDIAERIADTLSMEGYEKVLEIGPGTGVLTSRLLKRDMELVAMELDRESIDYLDHGFARDHPEIQDRMDRLKVIGADFLSYDLGELFGQEPFAITGNFPYNISTQIVFKMLEYRGQIPEFTGMFQKEVAQRICEGPGSKAYGILSVLVQAHYDAQYLFTVPPTVFDPPPKVDSGVLRLRRREQQGLDCDEKLFRKLVKMAFNQRRKTLRNSLKAMGLSDFIKEDAIFDQRPEQLSVADFVTLTQMIANDTV